MSYCGKFAIIEVLRAKTLIRMPNEVMLWLTNMMGKNTYIPLLIRQSQMNDAEENLNRTIFDVPV